MSLLLHFFMCNYAVITQESAELAKSNWTASSTIKPGSQYDAGAVSVTSVVSVTEKSPFFTSQIASLTLNFSTI